MRGKSFLTLLVYSGYLTHVEKNLFKIPNKEIKSYFYDDLLKVWLNKLNFRLSLANMINLNIENINDYKNGFQKHVLYGIGLESVNESLFQSLTILPFMECVDDKRKYIHELEKGASTHSDIDILLQPIKCLSTNVFIFELKRTEKLGQEAKLIKEAFKQILENKYTNNVLEQAKKEKKQTLGGNLFEGCSFL